MADPERCPRSATMHFLRAPGGRPARVKRGGRARGPLALERLRAPGAGGQAGGPRRSAAYSQPWEGPVLDDSPMPEVEPRGRVDARGRPRRARPDPPPFLERMDMQHRFGEAPFSGAEHALTGGWLGLREERPIDAATIAILADAWFPAPWPRLQASSPRPDDRPDDPLPRAAAARRPSAARPLRHEARPRRLLRRGRRAVDARRHARRPVAPAGPAPGREYVETRACSQT